MSHSLFDSDLPHPEPSNLTAFAANDLHRDSEHRDE
ncbi:MAG: NADH pyrophosphatase, partial [Rhizobium sp.]